uniref:Putative ovule protein n=1 Tax=Solanum chacoense TaxID=4108 RepID=A0A0V0IBX6_SOLCH
MASMIESAWAFLLANFSDFQLTSLGGFIVHESAFFLSGIPFILFERAGWFGKYKIQKKTNNTEAQQKCITRLLMFHFCVNLPILIVTYPLFKFMGMRSTLPLPSWYFLALCIPSLSCVMSTHIHCIPFSDLAILFLLFLESNA